MIITPVRELPERPEPSFDNTDETGIDFSVRRVLDAPIIYHEETTFFRRPLDV